MKKKIKVDRFWTFIDPYEWVGGLPSCLSLSYALDGEGGDMRFVNTSFQSTQQRRRECMQDLRCLGAEFCDIKPSCFYYHETVKYRIIIFNVSNKIQLNKFYITRN